MRILSINNSMNFQARIKISKPRNLKSLAAGTASISAGIGSAALGIDNNAISLGLNDIGIANSVIESCRNVHNVDTGNGYDVVADNNSAISAEYTMNSSLVYSPISSVYGTTLIKK